MTLAVLTPFSTAGAVELGNRVWRKKVLPVGDVEYKGRTLHFNRDYLGKLVTAFQNRAYDQVPFQLADAQNTHTNDPERTRGEIESMELGDDGLYITARLTPEGEAVLSANPKLGVSARIVEGYDRSDGRHFPAAVQHVLGTLDPRIPGLGAWTAIEAASPQPDQVIDLSGFSFSGGETDGSLTDPAPNGQRTDGMADLNALNDEQKARLAKLLSLPDDALDALANGGMVMTPDELEALTAPDAGDDDADGEDALAAEIDAMTDEELAGLEAEFETETEGETPGYAPEGEPVAAGLSAEAQFSIDLANARADETARELAVVTARLREEDYQAERRRLADTGVPPYITELARPLLEGAGHAVELSNGKTVDAGAIMRRVLTEYARQARLLDLDVELGSPMDEPEEAVTEQQAQSRQDTVSKFKSMTGL
jgi:hypothetical protein